MARKAWSLTGVFLYRNCKIREDTGGGAWKIREIFLKSPFFLSLNTGLTGFLPPYIPYSPQSPPCRIGCRRWQGEGIGRSGGPKWAVVGGSGGGGYAVWRGVQGRVGLRVERPSRTFLYILPYASRSLQIGSPRRFPIGSPVVSYGFSPYGSRMLPVLSQWNYPAWFRSIPIGFPRTFPCGFPRRLPVVFPWGSPGWLQYGSRIFP